MGLKTFDLAPGQFKDGGIATPSDDVNANTKNAEPKYEEGNVSGEENYSNHGLKMAVRTQENAFGEFLILPYLGHLHT